MRQILTYTNWKINFCSGAHPNDLKCFGFSKILIKLVLHLSSGDICLETENRVTQGLKRLALQNKLIGYSQF